MCLFDALILRRKAEAARAEARRFNAIARDYERRAEAIELSVMADADQDREDVKKARQERYRPVYATR